MSNEKNLKKLNKSEIPNVAGGEKWYILNETSHSDDEDCDGQISLITLGIYDNKNKRVGEANTLDEAVEFATKHKLGNLDIAKCDDIINSFMM